MRYAMIFCFIVLNMAVCIQAMNKQVMSKQEQLLRGLAFISVVTETDLTQIDQSQRGCSQNSQNKKKFMAQNYSQVRPRKKYASDQKLCASRCNSK